MFSLVFNCYKLQIFLFIDCRKSTTSIIDSVISATCFIMAYQSSVPIPQKSKQANFKHPRGFPEKSACISNGTIPSKNQASYHYNLHNCIYFLSWRQMKRVNHITTEARGVFFDRKVSLMTVSYTHLTLPTKRIV